MSVWSSRMPLANAPAILNLLDGPVDVDPAYHVVWSRFRMMRRYLAYCPEEKPRIFRMLDLISRGAPGHGPVHLLLISAAEIGFAWDSGEQGWIRVSLPPQGRIQQQRTWSRSLTFQLALEVFKVFAQARVPQRWWVSRSRIFQFCMVVEGWAVEVFKGFLQDRVHELSPQVLALRKGLLMFFFALFPE